MNASIADLVRGKHVLITAGAGGVGKTTTAAAISVAAAREGRRVLCLTIDPARRLAESLGLGAMTSEATRVDAKLFEAAGVPLKGELTAMMLDTKRTFDDLVRKYSSSPEKAEKLLGNKLYRYVSTQLAGTQEYMAMEKLVAVRADKSFDLIVLDTPPTANALDFLDAPERMVAALDSAAMKWFIEAFQQSGKFSLNLIARSAATVLRGIGKITGGGFLEAMAEFLAELNELFGGFKERAERVRREMRGDDVSFLLITSPSPLAIQEARYFYEHLVEHEMPRGGFIVNRFHLPPDPSMANAEEVGAALGDGADLGERAQAAFADAALLASLDATNVQALEPARQAGTPVIRIAAMPQDVHDIRMLAAVATSLMSGGV